MKDILFVFLQNISFLNRFQDKNNNNDMIIASYNLRDK